MAKASKNFRPVAITANDLRTGAVLYRAPDGAWVPEAARAEIALDPSRAEALLAAAKADHDSGAVVEPFPIEFDPAKRLPLSLRERIRAAGPTIALPGA
jgi:hypothetical protein